MQLRIASVAFVLDPANKYNNVSILLLQRTIGYEMVFRLTFYMLMESVLGIYTACSILLHGRRDLGGKSFELSSS